MTHYEKIAARAVAAYLEAFALKGRPATLFSVSSVADSAARAAGKKRDLHDSLWSYTRVLPAGWSARMLTISGETSLAHACPPNWAESMSENLLLGPGRLREATLAETE